MTLDYDPIASLESVGYLEREASFLYLVAIHSGYFLSRQFCQFVKRERGALPTRFLEKASRLHHIRVIECGRGRHIYHLISKPVYEALGRRDSQNRRIKGDAHVKSRLMVLDFILANLGANLLEDEVSKVDFFTTQCGVPNESLPRSYAGRLMYFSDGFPILVSNTGIPRFTFFDEGQVTATRFERYLKQYQPLFAALGEFELIYLADTESSSARASATFNRFVPPDRLRGVTQLTPMGVEHFIEYLAASHRYEAKGSVSSARDLEVLREGEHRYTTLEHRALQAAWNNQSTGADRIRQRFLNKSLRATFTTVVLPYSYPVYSLRQSAPSQQGHGTPQRTRERAQPQET
ncbi:hypothetical protein [Tunturibacter empetritectus]|uniref:Uncharacterized protein n=1 Tax=Tunturiibacter lichenicola TaxID=2051959 RepID=A0A7W8J653_9BACT|nr:hypothetical protein [Edaphobacter lichenicola]MBB5343357.1 hypothetical protein [Edaphobacter lichenicola]